MIHSVAVSDVRTTLTGACPQAMQFGSSRLIKSSLQRRQLWWGTDQRYNYDYLAKQMDKHRRFCMSKLRNMPARPRKAHVYERHHRWWDRSNGSGYHRDIFSKFENANRHKKDFWEADRARAKQRMEQIGREIEKDPYAALFGRRLEPFSSFGRLENTFTSLCRSLLGLDKSSNAMDTTARPKASTTASKSSPDAGKEAKSDLSRGDQCPTDVSSKITNSSYEFDPISGRMVPKAFAQTTVAGDNAHDNHRTASMNTQKPHSERTGYMSPIKRLAGETQSAKVSRNARTEDSLRLGVPVMPVADEIVQAQDLHNSGLSKNTHYKVSESLITPHKSPTNILKESNGLSGLIIAGAPKAQDKMGPKDVTNGYGSTTYEHLELPVNNHLFQNWQDTARLTKSSAPKSILDSTQEQDRVRAEKEDDLDLLSASDIRSHYYLENLERDPETKKQTRKYLDDSFDSFVDPAGGIDAQSVRSRFEDHEAASAIDETIRPTRTDDSVDLQDGQVLGASRGLIQNEEQQATQCLNNAAITQQPVSGSSSIETYRVFAYDPSTLQVSEAETSSTLHSSNESIHPVEVMSRLNVPAKFLPYFAKMHADGYEIVSGGGDILVFRKFRNSMHKDDGFLPNTTGKVDAGLNSPSNEALGQNTSLSRLAQSSIGAEHFSSQVPNPQAILLNDSGSQGQGSSSKSESRLSQALRRMFISGVATAGTCYAIGVVVEYFRTGGQDGRGIDAFTVFESERRHGD
ncbi:serine-threonine rich protein [Aspergillus sclerotioniger CBS 115572]|uniref:Serine-threonine rich protein n=1 Tax=Aspergillus sclerotioniger CBS 115572 TaxID=1450535 RepID=A0A317V6C3_9EURO|nr:serine-threonine rich protein [Aspergillus sclerotioniger CBS 115572]PWY69873.1 serine-threonine rich protein [Aspergillus sclerotioniger CBS 115572]